MPLVSKNCCNFRSKETTAMKMFCHMMHFAKSPTMIAIDIGPAAGKYDIAGHTASA